jgi:hypothetical protein
MGRFDAGEVFTDSAWSGYMDCDVAGLALHGAGVAIRGGAL